MQQNKTSIPRIVFAASLGGGLEVYDFVIYIFFAPILSKLFFPNDDHLMGLLSTFLVFSAGFVTRPLGGLIFGFYGDRFGRKNGLVVTLLLMGLSTIIIGCLPTYHQIGVLAPIMLTILRLIQGLAIGGDLPGALTFVGEMSPIHHRGMNCAWIYFGINAGNLIACAVAGLITFAFSELHLIAWGWRVGFWLGAVILLIGLYCRSKLDESSLFLILKQRKLLLTHPTIKLFNRENWGMLLCGFGIVGFWAVIVGQLFLYMPTFLHAIYGVTMHNALFYNTSNLIIFTLLIPVFGRLSDLWSRKKLVLIIAIAFLLFVYPSYYLMKEHYIFIGFTILSILSAAFTGAVPAMLPEIFPTNIRYSAIALVYNVGFAISGAATPILISSLMHHEHISGIKALNLLAASLVAIVCLIFIKDRTGKELL